MSRIEDLIGADPEAFIKLASDLRKQAVVPHAGGQQQVVDATERFLVLNAGRRWGKTKIGANKALRTTRMQDKMVWWVAPTYKIVKRGYREVLRQLPKNVLTHTPPPDTAFDSGRSVILKFHSGSQMEFYSAERPEGMLGEGVDYVVLDEAATMNRLIWEQIVSPTLMDHKGHALLISTPRGRNWFYEAWSSGQDPLKTDWQSWTFPSWTNPHLPEGEVERMRSDLPALIFAQEVAAEFLAAGSSVFRWEPSTAVQNARVGEDGMVEGVSVKGEHIVFGIDLAKTHDYTVIYGGRMSDRMNCYFERLNDVAWGEQKRRIARAVRTVVRAGAASVTLVMDSTGVGDPIVEEMQDLGYDAVAINFTTHKANMVKLLANDLEAGRAVILNDRIEEFMSYEMNVTPGGRFTYGAPQGQHDDVVSAKILQHHGMVNEGVPTAYSIDPNAPIPELEPGEDEMPYVDAEYEELDAVEAIGLLTGPPTTAELLLRDDVWGR